MAVLRNVALDVTDLPRAEAFWTAVLESEVSSREDGVVSVALLPGVDLDLVAVPEPKTVKDRLHLDLVAPPGRTQAQEVERLLSLGAVRADVGQGPDVSWVVLADPEGHEFCVLRGEG